MINSLRAAITRSLKKRPILTNTAFYASFYTAAEFSQQTINRQLATEKPDYDYKAVARLVCVGGTVYAPTLYFWYRFLDRKFPGNATRMVVPKVLADQLVITPILLVYFYTVNSILEGKANIFEELQQKFLKTYLVNVMFWVPAQTINFYMVPPYLRVVYVASSSFIWINILCYIKRQKIADDGQKTIKTK